MASERAAHLFPTAGDAYRFCQQHGLEISMANEQLWDIAEALHNASQPPSSDEATESLTPDRVVTWAKDIEDRHGTERQAGNVEELIADAVLEAWEWLRVNERPKVDDSAVLLKAECEVLALYSDSDDCICCVGPHRHGTGVDWEMTYGPYTGESGRIATDLYNLMNRFFHEMPQNKRINVIFTENKD